MPKNAYESYLRFKVDSLIQRYNTQVSRDDELITVAHGNKVSFFDRATREKIKEVEVPCPVYTASLLKEKGIFVCGGEDLKLYKFDYETGREIGTICIIHVILGTILNFLIFTVHKFLRQNLNFLSFTNSSNVQPNAVNKWADASELECTFFVLKQPHRLPIC